MNIYTYIHTKQPCGLPCALSLSLLLSRLIALSLPLIPYPSLFLTWRDVMTDGDELFLTATFSDSDLSLSDGIISGNYCVLNACTATAPNVQPIVFGFYRNSEQHGGN